MDERRSICFIWIFTALGTGCLLASCSTSYWQQDKTISKSHRGLWQKCPSYESSCSKVSVYDEGNDKLNAVRACMVLGILFIALASVVSFIGACAKKNYGIIIILFEVIALGFCITAMAVYTRYLKQWNHEFQWSYYLGWVGCGLYAVGLLIYCFFSFQKN